VAPVVRADQALVLVSARVPVSVHRVQAALAALQARLRLREKHRVRSVLQGRRVAVVASSIQRQKKAR
jgi:hypothetical protein